METAEKFLAKSRMLSQAKAGAKDKHLGFVDHALSYSKIFITKNDHFFDVRYFTLPKITRLLLLER